MSKNDIAGFVCRPYCPFYREGAKEDLICNGARLLEILKKSGSLPAHLLEDLELGSSLSPEGYKVLEEMVCRPCPFYEEDCDFRSAAPPLHAEPCGGFILLALLAGRDLIILERLKEIAGG